MLKLARILVLIGSLCIVGLGLLGSGLALMAALLEPGNEQLVMVTVGVAWLFLTLGLGSALAWQSWQAMRGRTSAPFHLSRIWLWALVYLLALGGGQLVLSLGILPSLFFPIFHVGAAILPPLLIVALVGHALREPTRWRDIVLETSSGALLSTALAFTLEIAFVLGILLAVLAALAIQPAGADTLEKLAAALQDPSWLQDPAGQVGLARSPWIVAGVLFVFAGLIPVIEEGVKTLGVGLLSYRRPRLPEAFLWGVACGAGFALAENLFNTSGGLVVWAPVALLRIGATLLHAFTGGLMGISWYFLLAEGRWVRALGLYAACVGLHAAWNGLAAGMALVSLSSPDPSAVGPGSMLAGLSVVVLLALLILLALVVGLALLGLTFYLRQRVAEAGVPQAEARLSAVVPPPAKSAADEWG